MRYIFLFLFSFISFHNQAQVSLRDTTVSWQHHDFILNDDGSMMGYTTQDDEISTMTFAGKVIENELIKLVLIPEYGGRVISFIYKPTGYEYLYQSACGSPYGIGEGNFYFDWLMVYGGIFPTFTEPEHGKAWFLPWKYSVIEESSEQVKVRMEQKDTIDFNGAPGGFNNGITNITCQVEIIVYKNRSSWDFDVTLINNTATSQAYEYWTCTTLTPGSISGNTGSPLSSKIVAPVENYKAAWSPESWIGSYGSTGKFSEIDELDEWSNMGIAYARELSGNYWGVINPENNEGIIRISENVETPGLKLWTWGRSNVDNNMLDFSNGGADNYIELWAGTSEEFFMDAHLSAGETKYWKESYTATTGLTDIRGINSACAVNYWWNSETQQIDYEFNAFQNGQDVILEIQIEDNPSISANLTFDELGQSGSLTITEEIFADGEYSLNVVAKTNDGVVLLQFEDKIQIDINEPLGAQESLNAVLAYSSGSGSITIDQNVDSGLIQIIDVQGKVWHKINHQKGSSANVNVPHPGIFIVTYKSNQGFESIKVLVN